MILINTVLLADVYALNMYLYIITRVERRTSSTNTPPLRYDWPTNMIISLCLWNLTVTCLPLDPCYLCVRWMFTKRLDLRDHVLLTTKLNTIDTHSSRENGRKSYV